MGSFISRNRWLFITAVICAVLSTAAWNYFTIPVYRSTAVIHVGDAANQADITSVSKEILSEAFISNALKGKEMNVEYFITTDYRTVAAKYASPYTVSYKINSGGFTSHTYTVTLHGNTSYTLAREDYGRIRQLTAEMGEPVVDRNITITIDTKDDKVAIKGLFTSPTYSFTVYSDGSLAEMFTAGNHDLKTEVRDGLINLTCDHSSSIKSKKITDALVSYFAETNKKSNAGAVINSVAHIDEQINSVAKRLDNSQSEVATFKKENKLISLNKNSEVTLENLSKLKMQKVELELQMAALDNISMYLRKNRTINNSMVDYGTITDPLFTDNVRELGTLYREKESQEAGGQSTASVDHKIEQLKNSISESVLNTRKKTFIKIEEVNRAIRRTQAEMSNFPEVERQLASMQRQVELDQKVYDRLVEKRAEAIINTTVPGNSIRLVQPAVMPTTPILPDLPVSAAASFAFFLLLATGIGLSRSKNRSVVRSRNDLEESSGIPFLGNINTASGTNGSPFTDLCTRILMKRVDDECQVITVTSTFRGEGKTFIATNIAKTMASVDKKVLMIDMNTQKPELESLFDVRIDHDLAHALTGAIDIHETVAITSIPNLEIISAGELKSGINSLLASAKTDKILRQLRQHYDMLIIDTPEAGKFIDAIPLMKMSDMSLYVINATSKGNEHITNAELIRKDYELDNMFIVLNSVKNFTTHTGIAQKGRYRKLQNSEGPEISGEPVSFLRKIALWFY